jgi:hypothetical protein
LGYETVTISRYLAFSLTVLAIASVSSSASAQDYSAYDLTTVDGVNAAREAKLGRKLDSYSKGCVEIPKQLPGVVLIGGFAFDHGCMLSDAIIGKRGEPISKDTSRVALSYLGWKGADSEKREALALDWVKYGLLAFENPLTQPTSDFKPGVFQQPQAVLHDGSISVSLWVQRPSGMRCESAYDKIEYSFLRDGSLGAETRENSFSVPCKSGD